ncbi:MAG: hypothetical protein M3401_16095 [Actinomycetota bacterium]|nr:hypothetical protein [Actinomycetota bacterium]
MLTCGPITLQPPHDTNFTYIKCQRANPPWPQPPHDAIDVDLLESWADATRRWAEEQAARFDGSMGPLADLAISPELEDEFRQTFGPRKAVAHHCTRLLPHEADTIRQRGLRLLDEDLVADRIAAAVEAGALSDEQRRKAETGNIYAIRNTRSRTQKICFIVGRAAFDDDPGGCDPLLRYWGGEAIRGGPDDVPEFATIGVPSIVVATLNLTRPHNACSWPALSKLFVGKLLGLSEHADVHYRQPVPGSDIVAIWQPGDVDYDRHADLLR